MHNLGVLVTGVWMALNLVSIWANMRARRGDLPRRLARAMNSPRFVVPYAAATAAALCVLIFHW